MKYRLDNLMHVRGLVTSRSQAESWIRLGKVKVNGRIVLDSGHFVSENAQVELKSSEQYVSRAALKLASVVDTLRLNFANKVMLDVGSSTGGFTDYALQHGAKKVIAVDIGTNQLHPSLRTDTRIELHEQTDISDIDNLSSIPDIVVIDVSFISLRAILPHIAILCGPATQVIAMVKPQFETKSANLKNRGIIKNDKMRRKLLFEFEVWVKQYFVIEDKADSAVAGSKGNLERFYLMSKL